MLYMPEAKWKSAVITIATDDDLTPEVDLGRMHDYLQIIIPTLTTTTVAIYVSNTSGGTFQMLGESTNVTTSGTGAYSTTFNLGGYQFIKIKTSAGQAADRTFYVRGYSM